MLYGQRFSIYTYCVEGACRSQVERIGMTRVKTGIERDNWREEIGRAEDMNE